MPRRPAAPGCSLPVPRAGPPLEQWAVPVPGGPAAEPHIASGFESDGGRAAGARRQCCSLSDTIVTETPTSLQESPTLTEPPGGPPWRRSQCPLAHSALCQQCPTGPPSPSSRVRTQGGQDRANESDRDPQNWARIHLDSGGPELEGGSEGRCSVTTVTTVALPEWPGHWQLLVVNDHQARSVGLQLS
jgi:hypothetical protein